MLSVDLSIPQSLIRVYLTEQRDSRSIFSLYLRLYLNSLNYRLFAFIFSNYYWKRRKREPWALFFVAWSMIAIRLQRTSSSDYNFLVTLSKASDLQNTLNSPQVVSVQNRFIPERFLETKFVFNPQRSLVCLLLFCFSTSTMWQLSIASVDLSIPQSLIRLQRSGCDYSILNFACQSSFSLNRSLYRFYAFNFIGFLIF